MEGGARTRLDKREIGGFYYYVTDEQLEVFASLTPLQRLQWAEEARLFTLMGQTPETARYHALLRRGQAIC